MVKETMTAHERLDAAIAMQPVDRVPVCLMATFFCARHQGVLTEDPPEFGVPRAGGELGHHG